MDRSNHYESAFEAYLRTRRLGYVAVDEAHRSTLDDEPVKSLDFVVYGANGAKLLVDVKGRRFPGGKKDRPRRVWETWSTREDIDGLVRWTERFGPGYVGLLVFVYRVMPTVLLPLGTPDLWLWHDRFYLLRAVPVEEYRRHMRVRSPRWGTVMLPTASFRELVRPFRDFVAPKQTPATALRTIDR
ncbi:MAG TPA: HYExAFE family protein [Gemmataceae bacterium]|jgi:hypothetical protein